MFMFESKSRKEQVAELIETIEESFSELRYVFLDNARSYDEALEKVEELEADIIDLEDQVCELEEKLRQHRDGIICQEHDRLTGKREVELA